MMHSVGLPLSNGLGNRGATVHPVRNNVFSIGYDAADSGPSVQFGHQYAPYYAPQFEPDGPAPIQNLLPSITLSKRKLKKLEAIQLIRDHRGIRKQELAFNARPFVLCGLPLRQPPRNQLTYTRRNGKFFLEITAHPRFGLPYGQDRLIPIWLATLTVQQRSRIVHFDSPTQLLDYFRLPKDGAQYRRMKGAFQRVFAATIFFGTEEQLDKELFLDWTRFHFFDRMKLWFNHNDRPLPDVTSGNVVAISEAFYKEVNEHPIPVEREVVAALAHAPGLLDFYIWIGWKGWTVSGPPARVPLFGPNGFVHQIGSKQYSVDRLFRHKVAGWLRQVKQLWPECAAHISEDGRCLVVPSSKKTTPIKPVEMAVNI